MSLANLTPEERSKLLAKFLEFGPQGQLQRKGTNDKNLMAMLKDFKEACTPPERFGYCWKE